jgi:hypothetical protein
MSLPANVCEKDQDRASAADRLQSILELHFHPRHGSSYWLRRQSKLGWNVVDRVRSVEDLWLLGAMPMDDLRRFSVREFIPRCFHNRWHEFIVGETAGTSGSPAATAYRTDEFEAAFVEPFLRVAQHCRFPRALPWLWVGPSGPHVIGKAVRMLAQRTGSCDPFSVDFDPRWAKKLAPGSMGRSRYLDHVTEQALEVLRREEIGVLFSTPPALSALAQRMSDAQREAIRGVHYGGMSIAPESMNEFRLMFPNAVHLAGFGNTLFGVLMEISDRPRQTMDYFSLSDRVLFDVIDWNDRIEAGELRSSGRGQCGRVMFHRLDESCLLIGVVERDEAERVRPPAHALSLGVHGDGLRDPAPPAGLNGKLRLGIY